MLRDSLASVDDENKIIRRTGSGEHSGFGRTTRVVPSIFAQQVLWD